MDCARASVMSPACAVFLLILTFFSLSAQVVAEEDVYLCRGEMYQPVTDDLRLDSAVVDCASANLKIPFQTSEKPWLRCIHEARSEDFDGVYPLAQMGNMIGGLTGAMVASDPVSIEKWYWLTLKDTADIESLRFGAIRGSNQHVWLMSQGLSVAVEANTVEQLFRMLEGDRVDVILGTERDLPLADELGIAHNFVRYLPLHAYFNPDFLKRRPGFLARFNQQLLECQPDNWVVLSDADIEKLKSYAMNVRERLMASAMKILREHQSDKDLTSEEIAQRDKIWQGVNTQSKQELFSRVLDNSVAGQLQKLKKSSRGVIEEIFLMDHQGLLLASSDITSDYWQGDEAKFQRVTGPEALSIFVDQIRYDHSTRIFLSQVSLPVGDGALMIGINIEKALSEAPL